MPRDGVGVKRTMFALEMERGQSWLAGSLGMKDDEGKFSLVGSGLASCSNRSNLVGRGPGGKLPRSWRNSLEAFEIAVRLQSGQRETGVRFGFG